MGGWRARSLASSLVLLLGHLRSHRELNICGIVSGTVRIGRGSVGIHHFYFLGVSFVMNRLGILELEQLVEWSGFTLLCC